MRYFYLTVISLTLLLHAFAFSQPKIEIEGGDTYDWGRINPNNEPLKAKIKIYNKGNKTLIISEVKPTCGCTTAPLDKKDIKTGEYANLDVTLKIGYEGELSKSIIIRTNDPNSPTKVLTLKANIVKPIGLSTNFLRFEKMEVGKICSAKVVIKNNTSKTIKIKNVTVEPKELKVNIKKNTRIASNKEFTLTAKYKPRTTKDLKGRIILKTDSNEMEIIELTAWGRVKK